MSKNVSAVSLSVVKRLPRYHRFLRELMAKDIERISSGQLAKSMSLTASQIRQDLNCFGGFGQQGYGYNVAQLHAAITEILKLDDKQEAILIGAGNLGRTIATHINFDKNGFVLSAIFDSNEKKAGDTIRNLTVKHMNELENYCKEHSPKMAILCIPRANAQDICNRLSSLGVKGIWNFSQNELAMTDGTAVFVENIRLSDSLATLRYHLD